MELKEAQKLYDSSVRIVKENQHKKGGFYASPPGTRYPYIYARDHSIDVLAAISAGMKKEAKKGLKFMLDFQKPNGEFAQRYDTDGNDRSYKEMQIDGNGLVLFALGNYYSATGDTDFVEEYWEEILAAKQFINQHHNKEVGLIHTINSIHEFPAYEHGFEIYANSACCGGLFEVAKMGKSLGKKVAKTEKLAKRVKSGIETALWSPRRHSFIKNIRIKDKHSNPLGYDPYSSVVTDPDGAEYAPAYFGVVEDSDPKMRNTARRLHNELWDKELGGLNRYPENWNRNNGGYGPWIHFTAMLAKHYTRLSNKEMADEYLGWCVERSYKYMLPEHITTIDRFELWKEDYSNGHIMRDDKVVMMDNIKKHPMWKQGLAYVTIPLIWPHAEYIIAYNEYRKEFL